MEAVGGDTNYEVGCGGMSVRATAALLVGTTLLALQLATGSACSRAVTQRDGVHGTAPTRSRSAQRPRAAVPASTAIQREEPAADLLPGDAPEDWATSAVELERARAALSELDTIWFSETQFRSDAGLVNVHAVAKRPGGRVYAWLGIYRESGPAAGGIGDNVRVTILHADRAPEDSKIFVVSASEEWVREIKWREARVQRSDGTPGGPR